MKKILTILIVVAAALSIATTASAQTAGQSGGSAQTSEPQAKRGHVMQDILAKLNLTDEQKAKVKAQIAKNAAAIKELRAEVKAGKISKEDAKKKTKAMRKDDQQVIKAMLTPSQAKKFAALRKEARQKNQTAKGAGGVKSGGNTPDQR